MRMVAGLMLLASSAGAYAAESAYQKVDFEKDCREVQSDETGGSWTCKGHGDYGISFAEGDLRQSAFYGHLGPWFEKGAFETFSGFNHAGDTIEWRLDGATPFATIRRWFVSPGTDDKGDPLPEVQVLVIAKVGQKDAGDACVVGYVEATANKDANALARKVADEEARDFACRHAEAMWHGERRATAIEASSYFEDKAGVE
ncbi:hypothetical protein [Mesorhizobium sp. J428]|uniref:hypothetical protein n=1 Tax=Mesorhizobium sp. J428 TaxID=2898440 RepID=UPI002151AC01|nr:hypothetical protein [Mesorhizobium sp. J428]MCR5856788.1 hypothetical protein [Mesorhizobium sp. J428]